MRRVENLVRVGVLAFPGCVRSGSVVPHDVLELANRVTHSRSSSPAVRFETRWVSARDGQEIESGGMRFAAVSASDHELDVLIVPGVEHSDSDGLTQALHQLAPEQGLLRAAARRGQHLLFGCSGTCLVAQAGLLDGRQATTSWWLAAYCRRHFPQVKLQPEEVLLEDGRFVSSAGLTSYFDLALWAVGQYVGADVRQLVARMLVLEGRTAGQMPYAGAATLDAPGPVVMEHARKWLGRHLDKPWTVEALARYCHTSERTLLRRFREVLGLTPVQYMQQLRVERAKRLLEATLLSHDSIAERCGYQDVTALQKVFKKWTALTLRQYRSRFGLRR
jgi:transcriptional regulator GlxA family with amidase domain